MDEKQERENFSARLNELCDDMGVPPKGKNRQSALATIFGVSQKGARKWLEAEGLPTFERCITIARWGNVRLEWLMSGRGEKHVEAAAIEPIEREMLKAMHTLPEYLKSTAVRQVSLLGDLEKKPPKGG